MPFGLTESDASLLARWRAGHEAAGRRLFRRHFDAVYCFFRNKADGDAEDLAQLTFLKCVQARESVREGHRFRAFILALARNVLLDHFRRRGRGTRFDETVSSVADIDPSPSRIAAAREEHGELLDALRRIPLELQIVLELTFSEELSSAELGEILGVAAATVRGRIARAKAALAREVIRSRREGRRPSPDGDELRDWIDSLRASFGVGPRE